MLLSEATIIITGAGSGFGKSMALYFTENNAKVFAIDIDENALIRLKNEKTSIQTFFFYVSKLLLPSLHHLEFSLYNHPDQ